MSATSKLLYPSKFSGLHASFKVSKFVEESQPAGVTLVGELNIIYTRAPSHKFLVSPQVASLIFWSQILNYSFIGLALTRKIE